MTLLALVILISICTALAVWGLTRQERMLQYPALVGWLMICLIIPQYIALLGVEESRLPDDSLLWTIIMCTACVLMAIAGYNFNTRPMHATRWQFDVKKLLISTGVLALAGSVAVILLNSLPKHMLSDQMWSGLPVKYLFFGSALGFSIPLALILYTKYNSKIALILFLPGLINQLISTIKFGRRSGTAMLAISILCCVWFNRRKTLSRPVLLVGLFAFSVFVYSIGEYRFAMKNDPSWEKLMKIELNNPLRTESLVGDIATEMENAAYIISAVDRSGEFNYGALIYNHVIATYIPRQLVGAKLKTSLMVPCDLGKLAREHCNYIWPIGTCTTGIAEAYSCFSFFGALIFAVVGYIMRRLWEGAMTGDILYQVLYITFFGYALGSFNGTLQVLIAPWLQVVLFLLPVFIFSHSKVPDEMQDLTTDEQLR